MPMSNVGTFNTFQSSEPDQITSYMKQTPPWKKLTVSYLVKKLSTFHASQNFITTWAFTRLPVHILTFYLFKLHHKDTLLSIGVQCDLFCSGFLTKILFVFLIFSQYCYHTWCDHINILQRQLWSPYSSTANAISRDTYSRVSWFCRTVC